MNQTNSLGFFTRSNQDEYLSKSFSSFFSFFLLHVYLNSSLCHFLLVLYRSFGAFLGAFYCFNRSSVDIKYSSSIQTPYMQISPSVEHFPNNSVEHEIQIVCSFMHIRKSANYDEVIMMKRSNNCNNNSDGGISTSFFELQTQFSDFFSFFSLLLLRLVAFA